MDVELKQICIRFLNVLMAFWYTFASIIAVIMTVILVGAFFITFNIESLGDGYYYSRDENNIFGPVNIPCKILEYNYNDEYIIANQDGTGYWIIDKKDHSCLGPMNHMNFDSKKDSLEIRLRLKKVD